MKTKAKKSIHLLLVLVLCSGLIMLRSGTAQENEKIAKLGEYKGYSQPIYDDWIRISKYVAVRDGTKLAVDIFRPAKNEEPVKEPLPVIWTHDRYHRAHVMEDGTISTKMNSRWLQTVLSHGYIIAAVDVRGSGASYGNRQAPFTPEESKDAYALELVSSMPYRNSKDTKNNLTFSILSPSSYIEEIKDLGVAIYHLAGWYDIYPRDTILYFKNLTNPQKIVIGPWHHSAAESSFLAAEHLRWYDYWLKGIDNGIMEEAPIYYYTMGAPEGSEWRKAWEWPLPQEKSTPYYFHKGKSQSVTSSNDGIMNTQPPTNATGKDDYTVDYSTTSGKATRWTNGYGAEFDYSDMSSNDEKGLTYTTVPLTSDLEVTGHPVIHLWVTSSAEDVDIFAYLEEVDKEGYSHYITEGTLRASHRMTTSPIYNNIGLPFHRSFAEDISPLPKEPEELVFDLLPTSNIFEAGHRIRVTLTCADRDTASTPELSPPPTASIFRNDHFASHISLPIIPTAEAEKKSNRSKFTIIVYFVVFFLVVVIAVVVFSLFMRMRFKQKK